MQSRKTEFAGGAIKGICAKTTIYKNNLHIKARLENK